MELPTVELTDDNQVSVNDIVFFQQDGKYKYFQVKSLFGGTPGVNSRLYPDYAIWLLISELGRKGIKLYKLLREEVKVESKHVCGLQGFNRGPAGTYDVCPGCREAQGLREHYENTWNSQS